MYVCVGWWVDGWVGLLLVVVEQHSGWKEGRKEEDKGRGGQVQQVQEEDKVEDACVVLL